MEEIGLLQLKGKEWESPVPLESSSVRQSGTVILINQYMLLRVCLILGDEAERITWSFGE